MAIRFTCNNVSCGKTIGVPDGIAGKKGRCPFCEMVQTVPQPAQDIEQAVAVPQSDPMRSRGVRHREGGITVGRIFGEVSRIGVPGADAGNRPASVATMPLVKAPPSAQRPVQEDRSTHRQAEFTPSPEEELYVVAEVKDNPPIEVGFGPRPATVAPEENDKTAQTPPRKMWRDKRFVLGSAVLVAAIVVGVWSWASTGTSGATSPTPTADAGGRGGSKPAAASPSKATVSSPSKAAAGSPSKAATAATAVPKPPKRYPYLSDELNSQATITKAELEALRATVRLRSCPPNPDKASVWSPAFGLVSVDANGVMVAMTLTAPQQASTPLPESQADDILNLAAKACDMVKLQCPDLVCGGQTRTTAVPLTLNVMLNGRRIATWDYVARKGKMLVAVTSESK